MMTLLASLSDIHTHGGGDLLKQVFDTMGDLIYGKEKSTFQAIIRIALIIGAFSCLMMAFLRQKFDPLIRNFFLPGLLIVGFLLVPTTSMTIKDHVDDNEYKVEKVPFFLGKFAALTSQTAYVLENLLAGGKEDAYRWTDQIYSGETIFHPHSIQIKDQKLEDDLRQFCRECVFRDLGMGLYTREELSQQTDLLAFFENNTSKLRTVVQNGSEIPCRQAIEEIKQRIEKELGDTETIADQARNLLETDDENLVEQRIVIDVLKDKLKEKRGLGSIGAASIMAILNFFEAALYFAFPLAILLSLLSFGIKILLQWVKLILWAATWPIFYGLINLFLNSLWRKSSPEEGGLTLLNSDRLSDLYRSMEIVACLALICVPILSWLLIKAGSSRVEQLSASLPFAKSVPTQRIEPGVAREHLIINTVENFSSRQTYTGHAREESPIEVDSPQKNEKKP